MQGLRLIERRKLLCLVKIASYTEWSSAPTTIMRRNRKEIKRSGLRGDAH